MTIFGILVFIAAATLVLGWLLVIADAVSGFGLVERLPTRILDTYGAIHNAAWISIGVIVFALGVVGLSGATH